MFEDSSKATMIKGNLFKMSLTTSESNKKRMKELKKTNKKRQSRGPCLLLVFLSVNFFLLNFM